jgi:hypothetical protein
VLPPAAATTPFRRLVNERVASNELDCTRDYIASGTKCRVDIRERGYVTTVVKLTRARSGRRRRRRREGKGELIIQFKPPSTSLSENIREGKKKNPFDHQSLERERKMFMVYSRTANFKLYAPFFF